MQRTCCNAKGNVFLVGKDKHDVYELFSYGNLDTGKLNINYIFKSPELVIAL